MKLDVEDRATSSTSVHQRAESKFGSGKSEAELQEMQKKMEAAAAPGPGHKALEAFVGDWKAEVKCWMEPGGPANVSQGSAKAHWILNKHFLEEEFQGEMMGKPFTGRSLTGFDNIRQTYNSVWISDMQTWMFVSAGKGDAQQKIFTLEGKGTCPASGRTDIPIKTVYRILGPDKHVFEMFDTSKGEMVRTMEITYTRK